MTSELTEEQAQAMIRDLAQGKESVVTLFRDVIMNDDTTKVGNLSVEELGEPQLEVRGLKELELISRDVLKKEKFSKFFKNLAEIQTSTSLSKEGFLLRLSVTSKKEMADTTVQERKRNKGWFKKRD